VGRAPHYVDADGTALTRTPAGVSRVPAGGEPAVCPFLRRGEREWRAYTAGRVETHGVIGDVYATEGAAATAIAFLARGGRFACQPAT
jgi:hypothetical protein